MRVRIVVADQAEARFYDLEPPDRSLRPAGALSDALAHLHDRDLTSDRPGRRFSGAPAPSGRRGAVARHATDGERRPRKHEAMNFARRIAQQLVHAVREGGVDRIVLMADPSFLGLLRQALPPGVVERVAAQIGKDLVHQDEEAVREHLPPQVLR